MHAVLNRMKYYWRDHIPSGSRPKFIPASKIELRRRTILYIIFTEDSSLLFLYRGHSDKQDGKINEQMETQKKKTKKIKHDCSKLCMTGHSKSNSIAVIL